MKRKQEKSSDVGVLIGRFQVAELHEAHKDLIRTVADEHQKVIIFLGLSPARVTRNNPLDFESRKQMILDEFPNVNVLYIKDVGNDEIWSKNLDAQIEPLVGPDSSVTLYGGRESFVEHYKGKYKTTDFEQEVFISGKEIRNQIGKVVKGTSDFRHGVIWAAYNQYPHVMPTVDVAIWNQDKTKLLLARKENEEKYRFIGGFSQGKGSYEEEAKREVMEEAHIEITDLKYIGSKVVDDWRYRREVDKIVTILFEAKYTSGAPVPDDDICALKWFDIDKITSEDIVPEHRDLLEMLMLKPYYCTEGANK